MAGYLWRVRLKLICSIETVQTHVQTHLFKPRIFVMSALYCLAEEQHRGHYDAGLTEMLQPSTPKVIQDGAGFSTWELAQSLFLPQCRQNASVKKWGAGLSLVPVLQLRQYIHAVWPAVNIILFRWKILAVCPRTPTKVDLCASMAFPFSWAGITLKLSRLLTLSKNPIEHPCGIRQIGAPTLRTKLLELHCAATAKFSLHFLHDFSPSGSIYSLNNCTKKSKS